MLGPPGRTGSQTLNFPSCNPEHDYVHSPQETEPLMAGSPLRVGWWKGPQRHPLFLLVDHSNRNSCSPHKGCCTPQVIQANSGSLHKGCCALQVIQANSGSLYKGCCTPQLLQPAGKLACYRSECPPARTDAWGCWVVDMPTADVLLPCCQPGVDRIRTSCVASLPQARATGRMAPPALQGGIQANDLRACDADVCTPRMCSSEWPWSIWHWCMHFKGTFERMTSECLTLMYALQGYTKANDLRTFEIDGCTSRLYSSKHPQSIWYWFMRSLDVFK